MHRRGVLKGRHTGHRRLPECSKQSVKAYSNWWLTNGHMDIPNELRELVNVSIRLEDQGGGTIPRYALEARNSRWAMLKALGAERMC